MNLVEEISRQPSIQIAAWVLMVAFIQVYSKNWEHKDVKKACSLTRKGIGLKLQTRHKNMKTSGTK
jgi:hypothetical protein